MINYTLVEASTLPETYKPNTIYVIHQPESTVFDLYISGADGITVTQVPTDGTPSTYIIEADAEPLIPSNFPLWRNSITWDIYARTKIKGLETWKNVIDLMQDIVINNLTASRSSSADKLRNGGHINGVLFDGSKDITITATDSVARIAHFEKGTPNGVATLDETGKLPVSQLPELTDDVLEYPMVIDFPIPGVAGKIYVSLETNILYRWDGVDYTEVSSRNVNTDDLAEGANSLYFTYARVRETVLTGLSTLTSGAISATDTLIAALGKLQKQVSDLATVLLSHVKRIDNPHAVTASQVGADPAGTASSAITTHVNALDPHPVYLTKEEADLIYLSITGKSSAITAHVNELDPHPIYLTKEEADVNYLSARGNGFETWTAVKTTTQTNSTTTRTTIPELTLSLEANTIYSIECSVTFTSSSTLAGLDLGISTPVGSTNLVEIVVPVSSNAAASQLRIIFPNGSTPSNEGNVRGTGVTSSNNIQTARISGQIVVGATAGDCLIQFASEVGGSTITIRPGSRLTLIKIM